MDDPQPPFLSPGRAVGDERIRERAGGVAGARVDDEARGLVDHEQVLVLVRDAERRCLLDGRFGDDLALGHLERDLLALLDAIALRATLAVDRDRAPLAQEPLRLGS